jgi:hypothetical protein
MAPAIYPARAPALAIAAFVRSAGGAAYSGQILSAFGISQPTLRRRRAALRRLGIVFIENGSGSLYAVEELARTVGESHLPTASDYRSTIEQNGVTTVTPQTSPQ